jgi:putative flippase GtrA
VIFGALRLLSDKARATGLVDGALLRFAVVGLITTILDVVLFSVFAVAAGFPPVAANIGSYSCGIATSFLLNRFWTFSANATESRMLHHGMRFLASNVAGLALSSLLVALLVLVLPPVAAKIISVPLVFIWNYLVSRLWVFR